MCARYKIWCCECRCMSIHMTASPEPHRISTSTAALMHFLSRASLWLTENVTSTYYIQVSFYSRPRDPRAPLPHPLSTAVIGNTNGNTLHWQRGARPAAIGALAGHFRLTSGLLNQFEQVRVRARSSDLAITYLLSGRNEAGIDTGLEI